VLLSTDCLLLRFVYVTVKAQLTSTYLRCEDSDILGCDTVICSYWHLRNVILCHWMSCALSFKGTVFVYVSFKLQDPLTQWHCRISKDLNPQQHSSVNLISCIFKKMLFPSSDYPEDGGGKLLQNVCNYLTIYTATYLKRTSIIINHAAKTSNHIACFVSECWP
jgi:hypothetical protein